MAAVCDDGTIIEIPLFVLRGTPMFRTEWLLQTIVTNWRLFMTVFQMAHFSLSFRMLHLLTASTLLSGRADSLRRSYRRLWMTRRSFWPTMRTVSYKSRSFRILRAVNVISYCLPAHKSDKPNQFMWVSLDPSKIGWTVRCNVQPRFMTSCYSTNLIYCTWWRRRTMRHSHLKIWFLHSARLICWIQQVTSFVPRPIDTNEPVEIMSPE